MSIKDNVRKRSMELFSDPRVMKLMQNEQFMKAMMTVVQVPGKVNSFTTEQQERFAKSMNLVPSNEVADLKRLLNRLETQVKRLDERVTQLEEKQSK